MPITRVQESRTASVPSDGLSDWERELLRGAPSVAESPIDVRVRPRGNMRTIDVSQDGYLLTIRMPSPTSIRRAMDNGQRVVQTVPLDITVNLEVTVPEYAEYIRSGATTDRWEFSSRYYGTRITATPMDSVFTTEDMRRRGFIQEVLANLVNSREPVSLWDMLRNTYGLPVVDPVDMHIARQHVSNSEYRERFTVEFDAALAQGQTSSWAENFSTFQSNWRAVKAQIENGIVHPTAALEPDAMAGLTTGIDERGRSFGIEIEVDFPDDHRYQAKHTLAARMFAEGLSRDDMVHGWHYAARANQGGRGVNMGDGYTDARNGWSVEFDRSVDDCGGERGCEIVSPIMYDTEQTWRDIAKVCELVTELGGKITTRHGLHVNIGARDFSLDVGTHYRLVRLMRQFDDVLIRVAHNPEIGRWHRGRTYCEMDSYLTLTEQSDLYTLKQYHSHMSNVNFDHMPHEGQRAGNSTRVEFRIFDGAIDVGRIQANVRLGMALVHAAVRGVNLDLTDEPAGTHRNLHRGRRLTGEAWKTDTERFRIFVDALFPRESDKIAALHCYAASRWQQR